MHSTAGIVVSVEHDAAVAVAVAVESGDECSSEQLTAMR